MTVIFRSDQLRSENLAHMELGAETLRQQLQTLFPISAVVTLIIAFAIFVTESALAPTAITLIGTGLSITLHYLNLRRKNPYLLIWVFIAFTSFTCIYDFYIQSTNLVSHTVALTIPLLCFFALRHQLACWYSLLFGLVYIVMSAGEIAIKQHQITATLQNLSAYIMVVVMAYLLAQHRNDAIKQVQQASTTDFLTGLLNRQGMEAAYQQQAYRSNRYLKDLTMLSLEIDGLKNINDRYGLEAGDNVLIMVAKRLKQLSNTGDYLARVGGGEFCILQPETSLDEAEQNALNLKSQIAACQLHLDNGQTISVTVSIGLTQVEYQMFSLDYIKVDSARQRAKNWGRDQIAIS